MSERRPRYSGKRLYELALPQLGVRVAEMISRWRLLGPFHQLAQGIFPLRLWRVPEQIAGLTYVGRAVADVAAAKLLGYVGRDILASQLLCQLARAIGNPTRYAATDIQRLPISF